MDYYQSEPEKPLYILYPKSARTIVPKIFVLLFLSIIFYLGILLNLTLLELSNSIESMIKIISLIIIGIIFIISTFLTYRNSHKPYNFYNNRISRGKKEVSISSITNTTPTKNAIDSIFKTYKIVLNDQMTIKHISEDIQLQQYLQQLMNYSRQ